MSKPRSSLPRRHFLASSAALGLGACGGSVSVQLNAKDLLPPPLSCPSTQYTGPAARTPLLASDFPSAAAVDLSRPVLDGRALDAIVDTLLTEQNIPAIEAALWSPALGFWSRRVGFRDRPAGLRVDAQTEFWWASVGKMLTASLVMQAQQQGKLSLSDPASRWVSGLPQGDILRVDQLLAHTSGLLSYNQPGDSSQQGYLSPSALLTRPRARGLLSCPGSLFSYSNTGYLVLALILEAVHGQPLHRLLEAQGLTGLRALAPAEVPAQLAQPHTASGRLQAVPGLSSLVGAGNVVGSAGSWVLGLAELLQGRHALLGRRMASAPLLPMGLPGSTLWYGLGIMVFDWRDAQGRERLWIGHSGGGQNANALVIWDPLLQVYAAVAVNSSAPAAAVAVRLLQSLQSMT